MNTKLDINHIVTSLREFWISVRTAARMMSPKATVDSPKLDATQFERILKQADLWLTTKAVEGFEQADLSFLSSDEQSKLATCVQQFRQVAQQVPPTAPATDQQVQDARPQFQCILEVLRPDKFGDPESLVIGKTLELRLSDQLPAWVTGMRIETGDDANGDPAIWIWVEVSNDAAKEDVISSNYKAIREPIEECLRQMGAKAWPYIRLRSVSEQDN